MAWHKTRRPTRNNGKTTSLNTKIGYYKAAEIAQKTHREGTTLKEMAVKLGYVKPEEFDQWVVPGNMVGEIASSR